MAKVSPSGTDDADAEQQHQRQREHAGEDDEGRQRESDRGEPLAVDRRRGHWRRKGRLGHACASVGNAKVSVTGQLRRISSCDTGHRAVAPGELGEQAFAGPGIDVDQCA